MRQLVLILSIGVLCALTGLTPGVRADFLGGGTAPGPAQRLKTIFDEFWDDECRTEPLEATFYGNHHYDDRLADPSEAAHAIRLGRDQTHRAALQAIDPAALDDDERIDRTVLLATLDDRLEGERFRSHLIPLTQQEGLHLKFAQIVNFQPTATVGDLENYLRRLRAFPQAVDATIVLMRKGMAEGRVPPRLTMAKVVPQLRDLAPDDPEKSPLWGIVAKLPADGRAADRTRIATEVREAIETHVTPAYARLADFVERAYLPACRQSVGLWDSPEGEMHYAFRARSFTTTTLTPDAIHDLGLAEIVRLRAEMESIRKEVHFEGDLAGFFRLLRTDPKFQNSSAAGILGGYTSILAAIDARLPRLFGRLPRTDYGLREVEAYRARSAAAGYYYPAPEDGSRPGYFYVNTSEPATRTTYTMPVLAYHEAVPGHHLQFALAIETPGRPAFRRYGYFPAYSEGWALYSESLPREVGLLTDPYERMGQLEYSAWRAGRLVVDTGLHQKRWTRDQAIAYLEENTAAPRNEIESEVDRYIAWPGQALAYKIGELKIRELRAQAERRLGPRFELRAFHDKLLSLGSVPLHVLEQEMAREP